MNHPASTEQHIVAINSLAFVQFLYPHVIVLLQRVIVKCEIRLDGGYAGPLVKEGYAVLCAETHCLGNRHYSCMWFGPLPTIVYEGKCVLISTLSESMRR
ncbi:hypothetical protein CEXT_378511 [Caerostris extrusa]|uniref:Uncharacterized protein n=1 Tax=Caerostris extrusa TaxID=172846 RepID=A0AAV4MIK9_CAEEX|nr:hypothetical protein CEXT_378511 [Caerostris extrusa]